jgi:hypothetical protein
MRRHAIGDWFFRLTFVVPLTAAALLLGILGMLGIADLLGVTVASSPAWPLFLGSAVGVLGLAIVLRLALLAVALVGSIALTVGATVRAVGHMVRSSLRGM